MGDRVSTKSLADLVLDDIAATSQGKQYEGLGEFQGNAAPELAKWKIAAGYLTSPDEAARADIIRKNLPEARIETTADGRHVIDYKGERGFVNKPGVSGQDVLDFLGGAIKYLPAAKWASGARTVTGGVARAITGGAATSVAEDLAAIPQGSEQGVDPIRAGVTGLATGAGQYVSPYIARAMTAVQRASGNAIRNLTANPGERVQQATTELGRTVADASQTAGQRFGQAADDAIAAGLEAEQAGQAAARLGQVRRFNLPATRGQITGNFEQQALEDTLRNADVSSRAGTVMRQFDDAQRRAAAGADDASGFGQLSREVAGRTRVANAEDAGALVRGQVQARAQGLKGQVRTAYEQAASKGAGVRQGAFRDFIANTEQRLRDDFVFDPKLQPKTADILNTLRGMETAMASGELPKAAIPVQRIENIRKLISRFSRDASVGADDTAALQLVKQNFDQWADGLLYAGKLTGDKSALEAFKTARALRARYAQLFEKPNGRFAGRLEQSAGALIEDIAKGSEIPGYQLVTKAINDPATSKRLLTIVGANSPEHLALKQGALQRVFEGAIREGEVSPQRFVSLYNQSFRGKNRAALEAIFSASDRAAIGEFAQAMRVLMPNPNATNPSKTGYKVAQMMQQLLQKIGVASAAAGSPEMMVAGASARYLSNRAGAAQARDAARGLVARPRTTVPTAIAAGAGGLAIQDDR